MFLRSAGNILIPHCALCVMRRNRLGNLNVTQKLHEVRNAMRRYGAFGIPVAALQPHAPQRLPFACPGVLTQGCCTLRGPDQAASAAAAAEPEAVELSTSCWPDEPARSHLEACQGEILQVYHICRADQRHFEVLQISPE